jgi:hypothetical protein
MRNYVALAAAALAMAITTGAQAQVTVTLTPSGPYAGPGSFTIGGTLDDTSLSAVSIFADSIVTDPLSTYTDDYFGNINNVPLTLQPNTPVVIPDLFTLTVPAGDNGSGTFAIFDANNDLLNGPVGTNFGVPEPGAAAMLVGMAGSGALFLRRRRS